jgi:hypothetical protein
MYIDATLYPDVDEPPTELHSPEDRADYIHRVCAAWDFHILPDPETFQLLKGWKDVFDRFPIPTSPAYHAFRAYFGWEPVPVPVDLLPMTPHYVHMDRREGRDEDPCEHMI